MVSRTLASVQSAAIQWQRCYLSWCAASLIRSPTNATPHDHQRHHPFRFSSEAEKTHPGCTECIGRWAICPHIRRWSDPHFGEYASKECDRCPESETIEGHEVVGPERCLAEEAARAVLDVLAREWGEMPSEFVEGQPLATLRCRS